MDIWQILHQITSLRIDKADFEDEKISTHKLLINE